MGRRLLIPAVVTLIAVGGVLSLGVWQIERRAWKQDLIATRAAALAAPPVTITKAVTASPVPIADLTPASATGFFRHDLEMILLGRAGKDTPGVHIATPLVLADGAILMVDRGWVSNTRRDPGARLQGQIDGVVTVTGLLRQPQQPGAFTPPSQPADRQFFFADLPSMAQSAGLGPALPYLLEAGPAPNPGGWPQGGQTKLELSNNHLQYSLTWFTLAIAGLVIFGLWARRTLSAPNEVKP